MRFGCRSCMLIHIQKGDDDVLVQILKTCVQSLLMMLMQLVVFTAKLMQKSDAECICKFMYYYEFNNQELGSGWEVENLKEG